MSDAIDISSTPIHLGDADTAIVLRDFTFDGESFMSYVDEHTSDNAPGRLMMIETSPADWSTWECHPQGAEIVHVLEGSGTFYQQVQEEEVAIPFQPGATLINPPGVWHTADVTEPMRAIYITPCPDTDHKPR